MNGANFTGSAATTLQYAAALSKLNGVQQQAAMSALGLSKVEKDTILTIISRMGALDSLTISQAENELHLKTGTLAVIANANANDKLTMAIVAQAIAEGKINEEGATHLLLLIQQRGAVAALGNEYAKAGNTMKGMFAMMKANPAIAITAAIGAITTVISLVVSVVNMVKQAQEEARQAALEAAREYEQAAESIGDYKDRVLELKKSLDEGNLSQEEAYNARKELLSIQDEIQEAYGKEAEAINLVGDSAESSADKLDGLTRAMANEKLIEQADDLDKAVREMEKQRSFTVSISHVTTGPGIDDVEPDPEVIRRIEEIVGKYKDAALESWEEMSHEGYGAHGLDLKISANATDAKETIVALATELRELQNELEREGYDLTGTIFKNWDVSSLFSDALNDVNEVIENWGKLYNKRIEWKIITDDNYADAMDKINDAGEALQEALSSGDSEALAAAIKAINALWLDPEKIDDNGVRNYMQELIDKMQAEALKHTVWVKLSADVDDDEWTSRVKAAVERLSGGDGVTNSTDILNAGITAGVETGAMAAHHGDTGLISDETQAYWELEAALAEYGYTVEDAIPLLEEYGLVTVEATETSEEATKAVSDLGESFSKLRDLVDPLKTAMEEMMSGGGLSSGTAQTIIEKLTEAGLDYVDYLYEENGALKLNTAAWADYIRTLNTLDTEGLTEEQAAVLRELYNTLTEETAGELYDEAISKLDELHEALDGLSDVDTLDIETFEKLRELMPDLIGNVHDVESAQAALTRAIQRGEQEAEAAYGAMLYANQSWVSGTINSSVGLSNALVTYYGKDVENWKANAASKWEVDSNLVQNLSELWSKYYGVSTQELERELQQVKSQIDMANRSLQRNVKGGGKSVSSIEVHELQEQYDELAAVLEMRKSAEKAFQELLDTSYNGSGVSSGGSGSGSSKEVEEYIADIEKFREAIERLNRARIDKEAINAELSNTEDLETQIRLHYQLINAYRNEQDAMHNLNELRRQALSEGKERLEGLGFKVNFDPEANKFFVENLEHINELTAQSKGEYETLQEATNALRKEIEDYIGTLEDMNASNQENSETWRELKFSIQDSKIAIIDALKGMVTQSSDAVDEIQNVYDTLHEAADEFASGGYITVDTFQQIISLGAEYMQYLIDENGMLKINHDSIDAVIKAKTQELAITQALTYVERLRLALEAGSVEELNELLYATTAAANGTWELVYANLALLDLDNDQYEAALHNINAIRALSESAMSGVGVVASNTTDALEEMKSGVDDILKYVMDMLKQRVEDQIDALEDMKDAYGEIIELRKESLDAADEEADYQEGIAEKTKEMAKLQERISALSLDNSRDSNAKRAELEEELAELQKELADDQADYAKEAQKNALDNMQTAYEQEKDGEIAVLEESISSTEKLYRMAIEYIRENWATLRDELIQWNYDVGTNFQYEIENAWEAALRAAQRYGDYVTALNSIDADISAASSNSHNDYLGSTNYDSSDMAIRNIIREMWNNSQAWANSDSTEERQELDLKNLQLGSELAAYGVDAVRDNGTWYVGSKDGEKLFEKYKRFIYHSGGIAGDRPTLKQNEVLAVLEKGEPVLDKRKEAALFRIVDFATNIMSKFDKLVAERGVNNVVGGASSGIIKTGISMPTAEGRSANIQFGDVYIYGANDETVERHREVNRQFVNEVLKQLNIKK